MSGNIKDIRVIYNYLQQFEYKKLDSDVKKQIIKDIFNLCSDELDNITYNMSNKYFSTIKCIFSDGYEFDLNISNEHV